MSEGVKPIRRDVEETGGRERIGQVREEGFKDGDRRERGRRVWEERRK